MKKMYALFAVVAMMLCSTVADAQIYEICNSYGLLGSKDWHYTKVFYTSSDDGSSFVYDDKDRLTQWTDYDKYDQPTMIIRYEYDEKGQVVVMLTYNPDDMTNPTDKDLLEYDAKGNLTKWDTYTINSSGNMVLYSVDEYSYGDIYINNYTQYDMETGAVEYEEVFYTTEEIEEGKHIVYYYKNVGTKENPEYKMTEIHSRTYDEYNNNLSYTASFLKETGTWKLENKTIYTYERDADNRLVKCIMTSGVNNPVEKVNYTVTYDVKDDEIVATVEHSPENKDIITFEKKKNVTSINNIIASIASDRTYNLQGQRTNANHRGICIKNGKKYVVK